MRYNDGVKKLVTSAEIAKACGVLPSTIRQWRFRFKDFPQEEASFGGTLVYDPAKVERWVRKHRAAILEVTDSA